MIAPTEAVRRAEKIIRGALESKRLHLDLSRCGLTELPSSCGDLTQLHVLDLGHNRLSYLPDWLGKLTQLQTLYLQGNQLKSLPEALANLTQLQRLNLGNNQLSLLPDGLGALKQLQTLYLHGNQLHSLPESFSKFEQLRSLNLGNNQFSSLPDWFGKFFQLETLYLYRNRLTSLPEGLGDLMQLRELNLDDNLLTSLPSTLGYLENLEVLSLDKEKLNPNLAAAYREGTGSLRGYLRELAKGGRKKFEAKLLILGDGNEGKTCVSRALRGLPFQSQNTTRGVEVEPWKFLHPDYPSLRGNDITLNIWDFEGQEISHQTHQFFLTSQSLYLLVFKCRDQFLMDRAEYWLDTIRARAQQAKVIVVISQCEERSPHIPLDRIHALYGDILAKKWFFPVGCDNGRNIDHLQSFLKISAANLEFMGAPWPISYEKAEQKLKAQAHADIPHITRAQFNAILKDSRVSDENYDGAANSLARIGAITQFPPECPDLWDFVVLKPQWLTKAISRVMEDGKLSDDKGEIEFRRMEGIWKTDYPGMFANFHNCMKEFELCYDLDDAKKHCLIPLRFGYVAPPIPWTNTSGLKERRIEYKLNIRPPLGIMSRFIVKTHHMIVTTENHPKGIYWHNGVFLRTQGDFPSEALCEFVPEERTFRAIVRAAYPQNMCEQVDGYIQAVFSFFKGLLAERSFGCIHFDPSTQTETPCKGFYTEKRIYTAISKERETLDCEFENHEIDPRLLVSGIVSFGGYVKARLEASVEAAVRREMDKKPAWAEPFLQNVQTLIGWVESNDQKLETLLAQQENLSVEFKQESESKLHEYLSLMDQMLDDREFTAAPGLILITTREGRWWNPKDAIQQNYTLTPYCECEGNIHPCDDGKVEFTRDRDWWKASAPWMVRAVKVLSAGTLLGLAGIPLAIGVEAAKEIEGEVKFMQELAKLLKLEASKSSPDKEFKEHLSELGGRDLRQHDADTAMTRAALKRFLEETAPVQYEAKQWGSLRRTRMSDNSYRWLCQTCAAKNR